MRCNNLINRRRLGRSLELLKKGDLKGLICKTISVIKNRNIEIIPVQKQQDKIEPRDGRFIPDCMEYREYVNMCSCHDLVFPKEENPLVSIIIPVYNQFEFTYCCLRSILKNTRGISYEVILADDNSSDNTRLIKSISKNLIVVRNKENLRFLKNVNNAAKFARGKYLLLLNNDVQVQYNWLKPLCDLMEDESVGIVGSKLVYPDGTLQEAGGIIYRDASGANYGRHERFADASPYNYVKECDYISGCSILIRREIWEKSNGFDVRFAPAYFEDADICFFARSLGYKVLLQPLSVVVHFEGVSNGTDLTSGQKQYQVINQSKFVEKWKEQLEQQDVNGECVFLSRNRAKGKRRVLFFDYMVPLFDTNAGDRTIYQYLKSLTRLGYLVTFIPSDQNRRRRYSLVLEQMGIEVLYNYDEANLASWIKLNAQYYDFVFINRPAIAEKYFDLVRQNTSAKIIYNLCDLHYLRCLRQYEVTKDPKFKAESEYWEPIEKQILRKASLNLSVSSYEKTLIDEMGGYAPVVVAPVFSFTSVEPRTSEDFSGNPTLLFVGNFNHTPNADAAVWFMQDVYPLILKQNKDVKVVLAGNNPPKELLEMQNEKIVVTGFISDEELHGLYRSATLAIIPLRYGAGVKGKVIEAMAQGLPIVSTEVGLEGFSDIEKILKSYNTSAEFSERCLELVASNDKKAHLSAAECSYVMRNY
jgi:GT2 family glycosyltransferase/glycosyltransferase involved in cell wall biosynthesis